MEYSQSICTTTPCDDNYKRFVGWNQNNECIRVYFSVNTVETISHKVTELLQGVDPNNRPIIVPSKTICHVMSAVYDSFRPETGDIYARYNIPMGKGPQNYVQNMIDQVIEIIVSDVKNNLGMEAYNKTLTKWTTLLGDFNKHGLRQHAPIKVLNKHPAAMQFNMNY